MISESIKSWIKIVLPILGFILVGILAIGSWVGKIDSDVQELQKKNIGVTSRIDLDDIEAALTLPEYKIEQNFQAIQKLEESQVATQKQIAITTFILQALEKRVTKGGN